MPTAPDHFFLAFPVELDGAETEGASAPPVIDGSLPLVVDVLGHAPSAGDLLVAYAVGGKWVAERGATSTSSYPCAPCNIPAQNLTISWVNPIRGNGSTALVFNKAPTSWTSACSNGLLYQLLCNAGQIELRVIFFTAGSCPSGTQQYCSNLRSAPLGLTLSSYTCSPFSMTFLSRSTTCPTVTNSGYLQFTITL
jgi:hypothetical protein